jgi:hypothetical protein
MHVPNGYVIVVNANTAIQVPAGPTAARPGVSAPGFVRYNSDLGTIEFYTGAMEWVPITNSVSSQFINGDGINNTFTLDQATTESGILVSINGTLQQPTVAYTVVGETSLVFAEVPLIGDQIDVRYIAVATTGTRHPRVTTLSSQQQTQPLHQMQTHLMKLI